jgi:hypothetical protein
VTRAFWCGVLLLCGSGRTSDTPGAGLSCAEPVHDFGRVRGGTRPSHEFVVTNPGEEPVELVAVKSSCGCLAVEENWPRRLEPGVSGAIRVTLDTANYQGPVTERVTLTSADSDQPPVTLRIEANVWWPVEVSPRSATFEFGPDSGTNAHRVLRILSREAAPLTVGTPESSSRSLAATLRTNVPGKEYELTVRALPPLPRGNLFGRVKLSTSSTNAPLLEIPVFGLFQPPTRGTPASGRDGAPGASPAPARP